VAFFLATFSWPHKKKYARRSAAEPSGSASKHARASGAETSGQKNTTSRRQQRKTAHQKPLPPKGNRNAQSR
jgi:hypothetical protein